MANPTKGSSSAVKIVVSGTILPFSSLPNETPTLENVRSITIREAARIQSFPDDFFFEGSRSAAFKQIGNAVPVVLAEKIGLKIKKLLKNEDRLR